MTIEGVFDNLAESQAIRSEKTKFEVSKSCDANLLPHNDLVDHTECLTRTTLRPEVLVVEVQD